MQIPDRDCFPTLLNQLGLTGDAVEVGVHDGFFSWFILEHWKGKRLFSVDPWKHQEDVMFDASNVSQQEHDEAYNVCRDMLKQFGTRSVIMREFSIDAAKTFQDNSIDFVYLDARHDYHSVSTDLRAWYPKVKVGGIIAGHDYKNSFVRRNLVEVKRCVDNFFFDKGMIWSTTEDNLPSWYVRKEKTN